MLAAVELSGHRALLQNPPLGTSSKILSLRLRRCLSRFTTPGTLSGLPPTTAHAIAVTSPRVTVDHGSILSGTAIRSASYATVTEPLHGVTSQEQALLHELLQVFPGDPPSNDGRHDFNGDVGIAKAGEILRLLPDPFTKAIKAMQQRDTHMLLVYLKEITRLPEGILCDAVIALPRATFTEFLRCLDPHLLRRKAEPTDGTHISFGTFQMLNLNSVLDEHGVRKFYTRLLHRMLILVDALTNSGRRLNVEEYIYLLRCAGAATDIDCVKHLWNEIERAGLVEKRNSETYAEFIDVRFLVDPLYTGYDKTRRVVTPQGLHKTRVRLRPDRARKLQRLRYQLRSRNPFFGSNKNTPYAEELQRRLTKPGPVWRIFTNLKAQRIQGLTERQLCNLLVAFGRCGALRRASSHILEDYFGIRMSHLSFNEPREVKTEVANSKITSVAHRIRPGPRLMHAIIETYCSNGEFTIALRLLEFISTRHQIPISNSMWREIQEWTYVISSNPVRSMWRKAGFEFKIPGLRAVELLWKTMTADPYNVQPDFSNYRIMIRSLLGRKGVRQPLPYMREAVGLYRKQCQEFEDAVFEYTQALRDGVNTGESFQRYMRARFQKENMWYEVREWCRALIGNMSKIRGDPALIPDVVAEFREFLDQTVNYKTETGYISLVDPAQDSRVHLVLGYQDQRIRWLERKTGRLALHRVSRPKHLNLSRHSLAELKSARLDPMNLLSGNWDTFRTAHLEERYRKRNAVSEVEAETDDVAPAQSSHDHHEYDDDDDY